MKSKTKVFNTGNFAEKVMSTTIYDSAAMSELYKNPSNVRRINRGAAHLLKNYFDGYMDQLARTAPKQYHHVYEFDMAGSQSGRLFKGEVIGGEETVTIKYNFTPARKPNRQGHPFVNKAQVMEDGNPIVITPKKSSVLVFQAGESGEFVYTKKSIVTEPGGPVANNFQDAFENFMLKKAGNVLRSFKFYERIEKMYIMERRLSISRINRGMLEDAHQKASIDARKVAMRAESQNV